MLSSALFFLFAGFAIVCAISMVYHRNPLYSAISLVGVFISLACIYLSLAAPFMAVVQILVYAGAIMVLVVFVIMLLNLDDDAAPNRLGYLYALGGGLGVVLLAQTLFVFYSVSRTPTHDIDPSLTPGATISIGQAMYTQYLLPVEIVGVMLMMAIIGSVILARRLDPKRLELVVEDELERRHEKEAMEEPRISF
ncbi:MAG: NADH-quinone oxidoreductase subunit J [Acidobacteria bacterium]|nr:NADH-quinone oxidoreductase subunit J [Acidobacteriota bacterium]MCW5950128.1 NADH-quinone oxidoreductase subunit J [Pyrinomonadaceae bacterium]